MGHYKGMDIVYSGQNQMYDDNDFYRKQKDALTTADLMGGYNGKQPDFFFKDLGGSFSDSDFYSNRDDASTRSQICGGAEEDNGQDEHHYNELSMNTLSKYGHCPVVNVNVYRTPWSNVSKHNLREVKNNYDKIFHLALSLTVDHNGILTEVYLEKNPSIFISTFYDTDPETEIYPVLMGDKSFTVEDVTEGLRNAIGNSKYFESNSDKQHSKKFVANLLTSEGLLTEGVKKFIFQNLTAVKDQLPTYAPFALRANRKKQIMELNKPKKYEGFKNYSDLL